MFRGKLSSGGSTFRASLSLLLFAPAAQHLFQRRSFISVPLMGGASNTTGPLPLCSHEIAARSRYGMWHQMRFKGTRSSAALKSKQKAKSSKAQDRTPTATKPKSSPLKKSSSPQSSAPTPVAKKAEVHRRAEKKADDSAPVVKPDPIKNRALAIELFEETAEYLSLLKDHFRALGFQKAASALKKFHGVVDETTFIPNLGGHSVERLREICRTGKLTELDDLRNDPLVQAMKELCQVHGIGPVFARTLYEQGIRTIADLRKKAGSLGLTDAQKLGLKYFDDSKLKIPFNEMRLHNTVLQEELEAEFGRGVFTLMICGSHRRQKPFSGDVDALVTLGPNGHQFQVPADVFDGKKGAKLDKKSRKGSKDGDGTDDKTAMVAIGKVDKLTEEQIDLVGALCIKHFMNRLRQVGYVVDCLAEGNTKAMAYARLPSDIAEEAGIKRFVRRLDIRFVVPAEFPTAMLYFTGSKEFNGRMRGHALKQGFTLNEYGLWRLPAAARNETDTRRQHELIKAAAQDPKNRVQGLKTEEDIFKAIDFPYLPPQDRHE